MSTLFSEGIPNIKGTIRAYSDMRKDQAPVRRINAILALDFEDTKILLSGTGDAVAAFCEQHNFDIDDGRTGVEKYLSRLGFSA